MPGFFNKAFPLRAMQNDFTENPNDMILEVREGTLDTGVLEVNLGNHVSGGKDIYYALFKKAAVDATTGVAELSNVAIADDEEVVAFIYYEADKIGEIK